MDELRHLTAQMAREGIRRLLVLSGDDAWTLRQAQTVRTALSGDGLWVGPRPMPEPYVSSTALKSLLGREFQHAFFDAREGFDVAAFAALAGTLRAGSWLVLLVPDFVQWPARPDADSLRWSDAPDPISTPNFVYRFCQQISANNASILWRQGEECMVPAFAARPRWRPADGHPQAEQAAVLAETGPFPSRHCGANRRARARKVRARGNAYSPSGGRCHRHGAGAGSDGGHGGFRWRKLALYGPRRIAGFRL